MGQWLEPLGIKVAFTPLGVLIALIFIGPCPSWCARCSRCSRTWTPSSRKPPPRWARTAGRPSAWWCCRCSRPRWLTGFALAFARAVGEYGSVIFIAGNMPMKTEIPPLLIIAKLEQYDYAGATAIAVVMLVVSFMLLLVINGLQAWSLRRNGLDGKR